MSMPGFTAEGSVYRTSECYRAMAGMSNAHALKEKVKEAIEDVVGSVSE